MRTTWVKVVENYIALWKASLSSQAMDPVISGPGTHVSSSNDLSGQGAIQNSLAENTENTAAESSTESDDMPSTFKGQSTFFTGVDSFEHYRKMGKLAGRALHLGGPPSCRVLP